MKPRIILAATLIFFFTKPILSQSDFSLFAGLGFMPSYGTAAGVEIGLKRAVNDNLKFQLTAGFYNWGSKYDLTSGYIYESFTPHVRREMNLLVPFRAGFNFKFGNSDSHPYLSVEWAANYVTNDFFTPVTETDAVSSVSRSYIKSTKNTVFVSLGFNLGYSFYLSDEFNIVSGVNWQMGNFGQFVDLVSGVEYKL